MSNSTRNNILELDFYIGKEYAGSMNITTLKRWIAELSKPDNKYLGMYSKDQYLALKNCVIYLQEARRLRRIRDDEQLDLFWTANQKNNKKVSE